MNLRTYSVMLILGLAVCGKSSSDTDAVSSAADAGRATDGSAVDAALMPDATSDPMDSGV